jgi:UPF0716 protein FxsA
VFLVKKKFKIVVNPPSQHIATQKPWVVINFLNLVTRLLFLSITQKLPSGLFMRLKQGLLLLFIAVPILEIYLLLSVGEIIGFWSTFALVILTAIIGTQLLRLQGLATLQRAQRNMQQGMLSAQQMFEGVFLLAGGLLLLTPGFATDTLGLLCLIPFSRNFMLIQLIKLGEVKMESVQANNPQASPHQPQPNKPKNDIIEGEFHRED